MKDAIFLFCDRVRETSFALPRAARIEHGLSEAIRKQSSEGAALSAPGRLNGGDEAPPSGRRCRREAAESHWSIAARPSRSYALSNL